MGSRLVMLYIQTPLQVIVFAVVLAVVLAVASLLPKRLALSGLLLVIAAPWIVEQHRPGWTAYWNDLKPALSELRDSDLATLALEDGGYFAGHVVAAGNPLNPSVRSLLPGQVAALAEAERPRYLAILVTPGSEAAAGWRERYSATLTQWGYNSRVETKFGGIYQRIFR
jgi:hypothetical protein